MECRMVESADAPASFHVRQDGVIDMFLSRSACILFVVGPPRDRAVAKVAGSGAGPHQSRVYFLLPRILDGIDGVDVLRLVFAGLHKDDGRKADVLASSYHCRRYR